MGKESIPNRQFIQIARKWAESYGRLYLKKLREKEIIPSRQLIRIAVKCREGKDPRARTTLSKARAQSPLARWVAEASSASEQSGPRGILGRFLGGGACVVIATADGRELMIPDSILTDGQKGTKRKKSRVNSTFQVFRLKIFSGGGPLCGSQNFDWVVVLL